MKFLLELLLALVLVALFFLGAGFFLPGHGVVERSIIIERPPVHIFDALNTFARFDSWSGWKSIDPTIVDNVAASPEMGPGAKVSWTGGSKVRGGRYELKGGEVSKSITGQLFVEPDIDGTSKITLEPQTIGVKVTWRYEPTFSGIFQKYRGLYVDSAVGDDLHMSLLRTKAMLESTPYTRDYADLEIAAVDLPEQDVLRLNTTVKVYAGQPFDIKLEQTTAFAKLEAAIKANKLTPTGTKIFRMVRDNRSDLFEVNFDVMMPIVPTTANVTGDAKLDKLPAGKALIGTHTANWWKTKETLEKMWAYGSVRGMDIPESSLMTWEEYSLAPVAPALVPPVVTDTTTAAAPATPAVVEPPATVIKVVQMIGTPAA
jgi:hypothetical protein